MHTFAGTVCIFLSNFPSVICDSMPHMESLVVLTVPSLGAKARLARVSRGLRQIDVAAAAQVTQAQVSAFERGLYVPVSVGRRVLLALGMPEDVETEA